MRFVQNDVCKLSMCIPTFIQHVLVGQFGLYRTSFYKSVNSLESIY